MTIATDAYLAELERLLASADPAVRQELLDGIREELAGLTLAGADARLRELGDPAFVAAGVLAEAPPLPRSPQDAGWYSGLTIVLLTVGGFVLPVLGWLIGLVMLWASKTWGAGQKAAGSVIPAGAVGLWAALLLPAYSNENPPPSPNWPAVLIIAAVIACAVIAVWLLVAAERARRR